MRLLATNLQVLVSAVGNIHWPQVCMCTTDVLCSCNKVVSRFCHHLIFYLLQELQKNQSDLISVKMIFPKAFSDVIYLSTLT